MRNIIVFLALLLLCALPALAEEQAVTESGKTVILYPNGTWKEAPSSAQKGNAGITLPQEATARAIINRGKSFIAYDPKEWKLEKPEDGGRASFKHVDGDAYAITICERMEITLDALKNVAITNAKSAASNARIISDERRTVNGKKIMALIIKGNVEGIPFTYYGYYYTGKEGTIQIITYTFENLFDEYKPSMEKFLNGFSVTK